ncbi:MAG TPA: hypothetical protein VG755_25050 [Nannocystaceae bacterium]|nr:hypothetical protein [Nannocystaceae bacterium]
MPLIAQLTVSALLMPLAITPPSIAPLALHAMAPDASPPVAVAPAPAPVVVAPAAAPVVVAPAAAPVVVAAPAPAPTNTTVVVAHDQPTDPWATTSTTTTTTTTTTTSTPAPAAAATPEPRVQTPKEAVRNLLRYDPYLAPRYRSGRNMMIGGGVMLGVGAFALLSTLSWAAYRDENRGATAEERRRAAHEHNKWVPTARVIGLSAAVVAVTGVVLLAAGGVKRRRAIEEARGRVFIQAGPGGMQVRF